MSPLSLSFRHIALKEGHRSAAAVLLVMGVGFSSHFFKDAVVEETPDFHFSKSPTSPHCPSVNLPQLLGGGRDISGTAQSKVLILNFLLVLRAYSVLLPCTGYWKDRGEWGLGTPL